MDIETIPTESRGGYTRRNVLAALSAITAAGVGTAMLSYQEDAVAATPPQAADAERAWCMVIDLRYCDGCKVCTVACQKRHGLRKEQTWIKV